MWAAMAEQAETLQALIDAGADVNRQNEVIRCQDYLL
jgi:hypothetical protein